MKINTIFGILLFFILAGNIFQSKAQIVLPEVPTKILTLQETITLASDSSLEAFRVRNMYRASYWQYRTYKAQRLPQMIFNATPIQYNRNFVKRYDSEQNIDIYKDQQNIYSRASVSIEQNVDFTGGTFFIDTELGFMKNFGVETLHQYSSVPIRIGYQQSLFGFNTFKWQSRLEPLQYEIAKKTLLFNIEQIAETATSYFFSLAMAQTQYDIARQNALSSDSMLTIGEERYKIASITKADLLTLRLDLINSKNSLVNAELSLKKSMFNLASFLGYTENVQIKVMLPSRPLSLTIPEDVAVVEARKNNPTILSQKEQVLTAERNLDQTKKENYFNMNMSASVGFNQVAEDFLSAYRKPLRQDVVSLNLRVPLIDWGIRKGRYNMARHNLSTTQIAAQQKDIAFDQDVVMTVNDFNTQQGLIQSAEQALDLALLAYDETKDRFIIGKADVNTLSMALNRKNEAQRNYISALQNYWVSYFRIRKLTLYNFHLNQSLSTEFDLIHNM